MNSEKKKISQYFNYSATNFGISLLTLTGGSYILYYYTDVLLLPLELVSALLFACRVFDGVIDPVIGFYMDRRHGRFGKYRGYLIAWALPVCVFHVAMFTPPPLKGTFLLIYSFGMYFLWIFSHSVIECAHRPMLITITKSPEQRRTSNTVKISMGILASLAASYLPLILVDKLGRGSERRGFALAMALFALVALGAMLFGGLNIKEHHITRDNDLSLKQIVRAILQNKRVLLLFAIYMFNQIGNSAKSQATIYYMKYNLSRADLTPAVMAVGVLSSFLTQPIIVWASKRVKIMTLMLAGYAVSCLGLVVIGISGQSIELLFAGNILFGIASAFPGNLIHVYTADLSENISGQNSFGSIVTSLLGLSARLGQSLSGVAISGVLYLTGYIANEVQNQATLIGIWGCLSGLTFISYFMAAIMAVASWRLAEKQPSAHEM